MTSSEAQDLCKKYDFALMSYKRSLYRCEWLKRRMLDAEDLETHEKLCRDLQRQERDAANKLHSLGTYDYQLTQLRMSTLLRNYEKENQHDKLFTD